MHLKDAVNGPLLLVIQDLKFPDLDTIGYTIPGGILWESCPVPLVISPPPPLPRLLQADANSFTNLCKTRAFDFDFTIFLVSMHSVHIKNDEY